MTAPAQKFKVGRRTYHVGDDVECVVPWPDGRRILMRGKLVAVDERAGEAYLTTYLGAVAGDLTTLERA